MNSNDVKKELLKSKVVAKFSHYVSGNLYYQVQLEDGLYQFPISTIESKSVADEGFEGETISLSSDLGTTSFESEIKASFLNRWIDKSIKSGEFIKVS
jgi:hypothetical protein